MSYVALFAKGSTLQVSTARSGKAGDGGAAMPLQLVQYCDADGAGVAPLAKLTKADLNDLAATRARMGMANEDLHLLAVLWSTDEMLRELAKYPEVLFADVVKAVTKRKLPTFVLTIKNSKGGSMPVVFGFMAHERLWLFTWVFGEGLNALAGHILVSHADTAGEANQSRLRLLITDDDAQVRPHPTRPCSVIQLLCSTL